MLRWTMCACLLLAALAAGCGEGEDNSSSSDTVATPAESAALTREEFIEQGDGICSEGNQAIREINKKVEAINQGETGASTPDEALQQAAPLLRQGYELSRRYVDEFRSLAPPDGDEETIDKLVQGIEQQVGLVGQLADAAESRDADRIKQIGPELQATRNRVRGLFQGYGFSKCGSGTN